MNISAASLCPTFLEILPQEKLRIHLKLPSQNSKKSKEIKESGQNY
jgi:hypothetical protein